jgi:ubiquinone biosynthesis protein UbiJ
MDEKTPSVKSRFAPTQEEKTSHDSREALLYLRQRRVADAVESLAAGLTEERRLLASALAVEMVRLVARVEALEQKLEHLAQAVSSKG